MAEFRFTVSGDGPPTAADAIEMEDLQSARCAAVRLVGEFMLKDKKCVPSGEILVDVTDAVGPALFNVTVLITEASAAREPLLSVRE